MTPRGLTPFALALGELKGLGLDDHHVARDLAKGHLVAVLNLGALKIEDDGKLQQIYFRVPKNFWRMKSQSFWTKMGSPYPIERYRISEFIAPMIERFKLYEKVINSGDFEELKALPDSTIWVNPVISSGPVDDWPTQARRSIDVIKLFILQKSNNFVPILITSASLKQKISSYQNQYKNENPGPKDSRRYKRGSDTFWFDFIKAIDISSIRSTQDSVITELSDKGHKTVDGEEMTKGTIKSRVEEIWKECGLAGKRKS